MKNKTGAIFMLWLVILTLVMGSLAIATNLAEQKAIHTSLVTPLPLLHVQDELELYELQEQHYINETLHALDEETFGSKTYIDEFWETYTDKILDEETMTEFIFENLYIDGKDMEQQARATKKTFVKNKLYSRNNLGFTDGTMKVTRSKIGKHELLRGTATNRNTFPTEFYYEHEQTYKITNRNGGTSYTITKTNK